MYVGYIVEIMPGLGLHWANYKCMLSILWKLGLVLVCTGLIKNVYCKTDITILLFVIIKFRGFYIATRNDTVLTNVPDP